MRPAAGVRPSTCDMPAGGNDADFQKASVSAAGRVMAGAGIRPGKCLAVCGNCRRAPFGAEQPYRGGRVWLRDLLFGNGHGQEDEGMNDQQLPAVNSSD